MLTKRNVVKFAKDMIVLSVVTNVTNVALTAILDEQDPGDETTVTSHDTAALCTGVAVTLLTDSYTDRMIDRVADWRINRKAAKAVAETVA